MLSLFCSLHTPILFPLDFLASAFHSVCCLFSTMVLCASVQGYLNATFCSTFSYYFTHCWFTIQMTSTGVRAHTQTKAYTHTLNDNVTNSLRLHRPTDHNYFSVLTINILEISRNRYLLLYGGMCVYVPCVLKVRMLQIPHFRMNNAAINSNWYTGTYFVLPSTCTRIHWWCLPCSPQHTHTRADEWRITLHQRNRWCNNGSGNKCTLFVC